MPQSYKPARAVELVARPLIRDFHPHLIGQPVQFLFCEEPEKVTRGVVGHDLEEFGAVVARHGLWRDQVREFLEAASPPLRPALTAGPGEIERWERR